MGPGHYENFPVASWLCPPRLRPPILAIYRFARTADDIADEGDAGADERLADLAAFGADLDAVAEGRAPSPRWPDVFTPLGRAIAEHGLPRGLLADLLDAFAEDAVRATYADRAALLEYCRRSANPIGRLLLHLYGIDDARSLARSDSICSGLQLANFWQDLGTDARRGRVFVPAADAQRHGVGRDRLLAGVDGPAVRSLVVDLAEWAKRLLVAGAPLVHRVGGRAGWELRLVVQGGLRVVERIVDAGGATMTSRPVIGPRDLPLLVWRALVMRADGASPLGEPAPRADRP